MEITVNHQPQKFYLALEEWVSVVGHEIKIGDYRFCAIPTTNHINISEVTTGAKVLDIPMNPTIQLVTDTKESTIMFLHNVGVTIKRIIEKQENFNKMLTDMKKLSNNKLGEMPPIEDFNLDHQEAEL